MLHKWLTLVSNFIHKHALLTVNFSDVISYQLGDLYSILTVLFGQQQSTFLFHVSTHVVFRHSTECSSCEFCVHTGGVL